MAQRDMAWNSMERNGNHYNSERKRGYGMERMSEHGEEVRDG